MKKKLKVPLWLLASFVIGYVYTALVYNGIGYTLIEGIRTLSFFSYPLILILAFYVTLTLHELGHLIAFVIQGIKIRALYLTMFVFYKDKDGWHFTVKPKLWVLGGGLVIPDLPSIETEETYQDIRKKFAISLIAAPITTIVFLGIVLVTFILSLYISSTAFIGFYAIFTLFTLLLSMLYIYTFKLSSASFYGDFVAYRYILNDEVFALAQIQQYAMFSIDASEERDAFLYQKTTQLLKKSKLTSNLFLVVLLTHYLDSIIYEHREIDLVLHEMIKTYAIHPSVRDEYTLLLAYSLCAYFYALKDVERAYRLFEDIQKRVSQKLNPQMTEYFKRRTMHVIHLEDQSEFLSRVENVYVGNSWIFDSVEDPYASLSEQHEKLPFVPYQTEIPLNPEENQ